VKQILCIHLPHWPILRYWRRHPEARNRSIAVIQVIHQRQIVIDLSQPASAKGARTGMSLAEARALCPNLICIEADPTGSRRALEALGRWATRFTPIISCGWDHDDPEEIPWVLFLDLTGSERLFKGFDRLVSQIKSALERFDLSAQMAVAPTLGAAWALAITAKNNFVRLVNASSMQEALAPLPVEVLRLEQNILGDLHLLGLNRLGDLLALPREQLPARFGRSLLKRLDQLTGVLPEPPTKLVYQPPVTSKVEFEAPIEEVEVIGLIFEKLLELILSNLTQLNHGIRQLRMILTPDRGWGRPIVNRMISLSRAHRHRSTLLSLIHCEMERIDCEHGFVRFQLDVPLHEALSEGQIDLFEHQVAEGQMEFERLLQRLRGRLGEPAVIRPKWIESYLPERAWQPAEADEMEVNISVPFKPRPLTLFPMPMEVRVLSEPMDDRSGNPRQFAFQGKVHRLTEIVGPERIAGEWWRGHHRTRDYYDVQDEIGHRFWLFRVLKDQGQDRISVRWFLHGRFD
jgi:protein ImuB